MQGDMALFAVLLVVLSIFSSTYSTVHFQPESVHLSYGGKYSNNIYVTNYVIAFFFCSVRSVNSLSNQ